MTPELDPLNRKTRYDIIVVLAFIIGLAVYGIYSLCTSQQKINKLEHQLEQRDSIIYYLNLDIMSVMISHEDDSLVNLYVNTSRELVAPDK